jgi:sec-independent protein translocase protein TatA
MGLGHWEIILIVFIILLLFGGKKFPEFAKGLGKGLREFKKSVKEPEPGEEKPQVEAGENKQGD